MSALETWDKLNETVNAFKQASLGQRQHFRNCQFAVQNLSDGSSIITHQKQSAVWITTLFVCFVWEPVNFKRFCCKKTLGSKAGTFTWYRVTQYRKIIWVPAEQFAFLSSHLLINFLCMFWFLMTYLCTLTGVEGIYDELSINPFQTVKNGVTLSRLEVLLISSSECKVLGVFLVIECDQLLMAGKRRRCRNCDWVKELGTKERKTMMVTYIEKNRVLMKIKTSKRIAKVIKHNVISKRDKGYNANHISLFWWQRQDVVISM